MTRKDYRLIAEWTATAESMEQECQRFNDLCEKDEDMLNDMDEVSNNDFAEGYAAALRCVIRQLTKV